MAFWRERWAGRCKATRRRRCGDIVEERQRRRCPPAAAPRRAADPRPTELSQLADYDTIGPGTGSKMPLILARTLSPHFLPVFVARRRRWAWIQGARPRGHAGVLDSTARSPTERNVADMPGSAAAVESWREVRASSPGQAQSLDRAVKRMGILQPIRSTLEPTMLGKHT